MSTKELLVQMATAFFASVQLLREAITPYILQKLPRPLHFQIALSFNLFQVCKIVKMAKIA